MAQIIKRTCPDCGHIHTLNANRFYQRKIEMVCRNCGADFVFDHSEPVADSRKKTLVEQTGKETDTTEQDATHPTHELELKWNLVVRIYLAWLWRTLLFSLLIALVLSLPLGFAASMLNLAEIQPLFTAFGSAVCVIVGLFTMKKIFKKHFRGFHIAIIRDL